ncbi:MAG: ATP-binding protein [Niabella sp.]
MSKLWTINITEKVKITVALILSILILIWLGLYANSKTIKYKQSMKDVNLSGFVITHSQDILNAVQDVRSSWRQYIMTGDSSYIRSLDIAGRLLTKRVNSLKTMPLAYKQRVLLDSINVFLEKLRTFSYSLVVKREYVSFLTAWNFLNSREESMLIDKLNFNIYQFINAEKELQSQKLKRANSDFDKVIYSVTLCVIIATIIILLTLLYIRKIYQRLVNTEKLLLKSQIRLESILDKLPVGVIIVNSNSNEYHANHKAVELLKGHLLADGKVFETRENIYTQEGTLKPDLRDKLLITNAIKGEENIGFNETILTVDGKEIPFRISSIPLYNEQGKIEYAICVFDDITNLKAVESELIQAKKLVEESLKLKESFLSNMSHEIRTPINAILGFAELLGKEDLGEQDNEYVRIIRSAGESLLRLLNDILDFSKLESNMMVFEEHPLSIDGILSSTCNLYQAKARNKGVILSYECDEHIPGIVLGDPVRLTQVITNIIDNAIKFTPKGSVLIFAKLVGIDDKHTTIKFDIKDSGIGISKDKLTRVFKRFEQAGAETTRYYGGTGLGLSIAKHIVESQGGTISVTSEPDVGSMFTFVMPFNNFDNSAHTNDTKLAAVNDLSFLEGLKVLVVEDNLLNIKLISSIFMGYDLQMDIAETGTQALEKIKKNAYDIVLMDIELPDMNGYNTTKYIRNELGLDVPIIALTAHVLAGEKERCLQAGMNDYLTKPVNTRQMFEKIASLLKKNHTETNADNGSHFKPLATAAQRQPVSSGSLIDLSYLREFSDNNREFEKEVMELFLQQAPAQLSELELAVQDKNYSEIKMISHKLKSSVIVIVGNRLKPHFELLEQSAGKNDLGEEVINSYKIIRENLALATAQLQQLLETEYQD